MVLNWVLGRTAEDDGDQPLSEFEHLASVLRGISFSRANQIPDDASIANIEAIGFKRTTDDEKIAHAKATADANAMYFYWLAENRITRPLIPVKQQKDWGPADCNAALHAEGEASLQRARLPQAQFGPKDHRDVQQPICSIDLFERNNDIGSLSILIIAYQYVQNATAYRQCLFGTSETLSEATKFEDDPLRNLAPQRPLKFKYFGTNRSFFERSPQLQGERADSLRGGYGNADSNIAQLRIDMPYSTTNYPDNNKLTPIAFEIFRHSILNN